nr:hypothetical protein GCM10020092_023020 [Actinoplanes digitatis]
MQTDIISYGANLTAYLGAEFGGVPAEPGRASVAFWRDLVG